VGFFFFSVGIYEASEVKVLAKVVLVVMYGVFLDE
jgi:hypothetical protein